MDFLSKLNAFNGKPTPKVEPKKKAEVTFVMTSCGRVDLMEQTLDSFFKYNKYPIKRYIITEDSADPNVFAECINLNNKKYGGKLEFMFNETKLGQVKSIDNAYQTIDTEYVFHCEEDWEFYRSGFIEASLKVLESDPNILQAWIRPKSDRILNQIEPTVQSLPDATVFRNVLPASFVVRGAGERNGDLVIRNYMGFSWNPGLKRMADYELLPQGYAGAGVEHMVDAFYRMHAKGFKVVSLSRNDEDGYVRHIGWNRRAGDPKFGVENRVDFETAQQEAKERAEKRVEEIKKKQQSTPAPAPKPEPKEVANEEPKVLLPLVSVVMQTFLGDYPGSRTNPVEKFHRAVQSFLNQSYKRAELIIVSDGCQLTHLEYVRHYKDNPMIKYAFVSKNGPSMYEQIEGQKTFRGIPRKIGVALAEGELITYMDSDDYLDPAFLYQIVLNYNLKPEADWYVNRSWYDHVTAAKFDFGGLIEKHDDSKLKFSEELNEYFVRSDVAQNLVVQTPWLITHKASCKTEWRNTIGQPSEDVDFSKRLRAEYKNGAVYNAPTYYRCHYSKVWDV